MTFLYTFIFFLAFNLSFGIPQHTQKYLPPFRLSSSAMRNHNGHFYQDGIFVRTTTDSLFVRKLYERCLVLNMCPKYYRLITLKLLSQSSGASFFFFFKPVFCISLWSFVAYSSCLAPDHGSCSYPTAWSISCSISLSCFSLSVRTYPSCNFHSRRWDQAVTFRAWDYEKSIKSQRPADRIAYIIHHPIYHWDTHLVFFFLCEHSCCRTYLSSLSGRQPSSSPT